METAVGNVLWIWGQTSQQERGKIEVQVEKGKVWRTPEPVVTEGIEKVEQEIWKS